MLHQQVSVDYWAMGKAMLMYGFLTAMGWLMMRLFNTVFTLPGRLRAQQDNIQNTLQELQKRFPDLNITEEDLKNAEKDLEEFMKEDENEKKTEPELEANKNTEGEKENTQGENPDSGDKDKDNLKLEKLEKEENLNQQPTEDKKIK